MFAHRLALTFLLRAEERQKLPAQRRAPIQEQIPCRYHARLCSEIDTELSLTDLDIGNLLTDNIILLAEQARVGIVEFECVCFSGSQLC
jgi:hypothetical protein